MFEEYFEFISSVHVTKSNETVINYIRYLLRYGDDDLGASQFCADTLNELFMKFFEEMKTVGKINMYKDDYLN